MHFDFIDSNLFISVLQNLIVLVYLAYFVRWGIKQYEKERIETYEIVRGSIARLVIFIVLTAVVFNGINFDHVEEPSRTVDDSYHEEILRTTPTMTDIHKKDSIREYKLMHDLEGPSLAEEEAKNSAYIDSILNTYK